MKQCKAAKLIATLPQGQGVSREMMTAAVGKGHVSGEPHRFVGTLTVTGYEVVTLDKGEPAVLVGMTDALEVDCLGITLPREGRVVFAAVEAGKQSYVAPFLVRELNGRLVFSPDSNPVLFFLPEELRIIGAVVRVVTRGAEGVERTTSCGVGLPFLPVADLNAFLNDPCLPQIGGERAAEAKAA